MILLGFLPLFDSGSTSSSLLSEVSSCQTFDLDLAMEAPEFCDFSIQVPEFCCFGGERMRSMSLLVSCNEGSSSFSVASSTSFSFSSPSSSSLFSKDRTWELFSGVFLFVGGWQMILD